MVDTLKVTIQLIENVERKISNQLYYMTLDVQDQVLNKMNFFFPTFAGLAYTIPSICRNNLENEFCIFSFGRPILFMSFDLFSKNKTQTKVLKERKRACGNIFVVCNH